MLKNVCFLTFPREKNKTNDYPELQMLGNLQDKMNSSINCSDEFEVLVNQVEQNLKDFYNNLILL